jgi:hypothetical protein
MIWSDPIVDEVRRVRDAYAARFNYDLRAIYRDLKEKEKQNGRAVAPGVNGSPAVEQQQVRVSPSPVQEPTE